MLSSTIEGQVVITHVEKGSYIGLEGVGNRIWDLLGEPVRVDEICDVLLEEYDVQPAQCREEVLAFIDKLESNGLIQVQNSGPAK